MFACFSDASWLGPSVLWAQSAARTHPPAMFVDDIMLLHDVYDMFTGAMYDILLIHLDDCIHTHLNTITEYGTRETHLSLS